MVGDAIGTAFVNFRLLTEDVFGKFYVCTLGAGLVGKFGSANTAYEFVEAEKEVQVEMSGKDLAVSLGYVVIAANLLDIDFALAEAIDKPICSKFRRWR